MRGGTATTQTLRRLWNFTVLRAPRRAWSAPASSCLWRDATGTRYSLPVLPEKIVIPAALFLSAALNLTVFFQPPFAAIKYLWLINGICQSVLWPSLVLTLGPPGCGSDGSGRADLAVLLRPPDRRTLCCAARGGDNDRPKQPESAWRRAGRSPGSLRAVCGGL